MGRKKCLTGGRMVYLSAIGDRAFPVVGVRVRWTSCPSAFSTCFLQAPEVSCPQGAVSTADRTVLVPAQGHCVILDTLIVLQARP